MLSWQTRKRLFLLLICLLLANILVGSHDTTTAADGMIMKEADALMKQGKYSEALQLLNRVLDFRTGDAEPFERRLKEVQEMQASDMAFANGMQCYTEGDYKKALEFFRKVLPRDVENFTKARQYICELDMTVVKEVIKEKEAAE